jgi:hypothetical protein
MRRSIMALEDLDPSNLTQETPVEAFDPDTVVQNDLLELDNISQDNEELTAAIEDAENAQQALTDMAKELLPAVADGADGISPQEAAIIETAVEHFKSIIQYAGKKKFPAMESFGGTMSKLEGTKVAIEELEQLATEVNQQLQKAYVMEYEGTVTSTTQLEKTRSALLVLANETNAKLQEFYKSEKYKPEFNGAELNPATYVANIFNSKEAIDGKMPVAAVIAGLNAFKAGLSTNAFLPKVQELKTIVSSFNNNADLNKEAVKEYFKQAKALFENIISSKAYVTDSTSIKTVEYPLSGTKLEISSCLDEYVEKYNYWYGSTSYSKEACDKDKCKLNALGDQESSTVLTVVTELLQSNEFTKEIGLLVDEAIKLSQKKDTLYEAIKLKDTKEADKFYDEIYKFKNTISDTLYFFTNIARIEVLIITSLIDYSKDSVAYLATRDVAI